MWQHLRAILLLPFMAAGVIPAILLFVTGFGGSKGSEELTRTKVGLPGERPSTQAVLAFSEDQRVAAVLATSLRSDSGPVPHGESATRSNILDRTVPFSPGFVPTCTIHGQYRASA